MAAAAAAISSPPPPPPPPSATAGAALTRSLRPPSLRFSPRPILISSRLYSSKSNGSLENDNPNPNPSPSIIHHALPSPNGSSSLNPNFAPVFVTLPVDAVSVSKGKVTRRRTMEASIAALAAAGVEGITVEVWWGVAEREAPGVYDWGGYLDLVAMAGRCGLKVRAVMAFHQHCGDPPLWLVS